MANASNALTGYWEEHEYSGSTLMRSWKLAWAITQNANFTYTLNMKLYLNTHGTNYYEEFKPRLMAGGEYSSDGTYAIYGGSTSYVLVHEHNFTLPCPPSGSQAKTIKGIRVNEDDSYSTEVWGWLTLPSFSGAYVKIDATTYKHAMTWIKVNGTWKRCRQYAKVNGVWKLGNYVWLYNP